ncbi:MAG: RcpC/CpaB family pilus assembly protein [Ruthenibacterium sp.]
MNKILQNRISLGCLSVLLAAVLCFGLAPLMQKASLQETEVYVMSTSLEKGAQITETDIMAIAVPLQYLPKNTLQRKADMVGQYASTDLVVGDYLLQEKLSATPTVENKWAKQTDGSQLAISVTVKSFAAGLAAKLQPGDIVSFVSARNTGAGTTEIPRLLQYVKVLAVTADTAQDYDAQNVEQEILPGAITVLVSPAQARLLADLELNSTLHIALACRDNNALSQELLAQQALVQPEAQAEVSADA